MSSDDESDGRRDREDGRRPRARRTAETLMRLALPLLDASGDLLAAARLQHAIDSLPAEQVSM